ncbi:MAG: glucosylceramidase [Candidatus Izimaplasma sp.]|nr:glucosylceramidase [Candidatus Izimaplasma bacterium]
MIKHYQSSKYNKDFLRLVKQANTNKGLDLRVDPNITYQKILGFGGAFTEAAAYTFYQMPESKQKEVLSAYFSKNNGLRYNLGRVSINSCDFSLGNYTYVEENDKSLSSFNIDRDLEYVIPMILEAEKIRQDNIQILASPWSPPAWMKSNKDMNHGGHLLEEYKDVWATYFIKFLENYKKHGISIFALTVQNEPAAKQVWDSCLYSAEEEKDFVKNYLGPKLIESAFKNTKLLIWDHNRDLMLDRAKVAYNDKEASRYIWGVAYHWYVSEHFENLKKVHELNPDKHLLFTEGTIEGGVHLHQFETGERYARNMVGDFSNYSEGYIEWNLMLNEEGGPNHVGNFCDAPIIYDRNNNEIIYNSSFYIIGHFSRFIDEGAYRIKSSIDSSKLTNVAFRNPNGELVVVVQNETEKSEVINIHLKSKHSFNIQPRSISTIIIEGDEYE